MADTVRIAGAHSTISAASAFYKLPAAGGFYFKDPKVEQHYQILDCLTERVSGPRFVVRQRYDDHEGIKMTAQLFHERDGGVRFSEKYRLLSGFNQRNLPKVLDSGKESLFWPVDNPEAYDEGGPFLITEFLAGATLREFLASDKRPSLSEIADIFTQVCDALEYIHLTQEVVHGKLTSDAIFISPSDFETERLGVKILGFGSAYRQSGSIHLAGAEMFLHSSSPIIPPERRMIGHGHRSLPQWDTYALGVNLGEALHQGSYLLTKKSSDGYPRKTHDEIPALQQEILNAKFQKKFDYANVLEQLRNFISEMTNSNPVARPDLRKVKQVLEHLLKEVHKMQEIQQASTMGPAAPLPRTDSSLSPTLPMNAGAPPPASTAATLVISQHASSTPTQPIPSGTPTLHLPATATTVVIPTEHTQHPSHAYTTTEIIDTRKRPKVADPTSRWNKILSRFPLLRRLFR
jgi:serine/threonine protein kinase